MPSEDKLLSNIGALCNMVRRIAVEAGAITLEYYDSPDAHVEKKVDGSPVSQADREAEVFIEKALKKLTPNIPMLGEEAVSAGRVPDLDSAEYFWVVDPLDGTKEFISGGSDFTVNIALVRGKEPVLGVVFVPVTGVLYAGHAEGTAIRWQEDTGKEKSISVRAVPPEGMVVVASRSHGSKDKLDDFLESYKVQKLVQRGSSLKICAIAEGKADMYPRFGPTCEWDTAAGHAVLKAAGGYMTDINGHPVIYGGADPKFLNPEFIACSFPWWEETAA